ncbi:MAG: 4Fe-4S dicluster domain-containing protein [Candidatus Omnitrophota bacterium]
MATKKLKLKINIEKCKGCVFCVNVCPRKALELSKEVNKKGFRYVVLKDPDKCNGCGLCAVMCPDCSITLEEE